MSKRFWMIPLCALTLSTLGVVEAQAKTLVPQCGKTYPQPDRCMELTKTAVGYYDGALAVELKGGVLSIQSPGVGLVLSPTDLNVDAATPMEAIVAQGSDGRWGFGMNSLKEMAEIIGSGQPNSLKEMAELVGDGPDSVAMAAADGYVTIEVWNQPIRGLSIFDARPGKGIVTHPGGQGEIRTNPHGEGGIAESIHIDPSPYSLLDEGEAGDNIIDEGEAGENLFPKVRILIDTDASRTGRDPAAGVWGGISVDVAGERIVDNAPFDVAAVEGLLPFITDSVRLGSEVEIGQLVFAGDRGFELVNDGTIRELDAIEGAALLVSGDGTIGAGQGFDPVKTGK